METLLSIIVIIVCCYIILSLIIYYFDPISISEKKLSQKERDCFKERK